MGWRDGVWFKCKLKMVVRVDCAVRVLVSFLFFFEFLKNCSFTITDMIKFLAWFFSFFERKSYFSFGRSLFKIITGFFSFGGGKGGGIGRGGCIRFVGIGDVDRLRFSLELKELLSLEFR